MSNPLEDKMKLSMAAESAAAARNRLYAAKARKEGDLPLAKLMTAVAAGEQISARRALIYLRGKIGDADAYLETLRRHKKEAATQAYPARRKAATDAGDRSAAAAFEQFGKVSHNHAVVLDKTDITAGEHEFFVCQVCGYIAVDAVPEQCPICGAVPGRFKQTNV